MTSAEVSGKVDMALARHRPDLWRSSSGSAQSIDIEAFEARFGYLMPDSFRHVQLATAGVQLLERAQTGGGLYRATNFAYFGGEIEHRYDSLLAELYLRRAVPDEFKRWLKMLVPFADEGDYDMVCLDFAFDSVNPPVIVLHYERGAWPEGPGHEASYVADDLLQHLELSEAVAEDGSYEPTANRVTQRMVDWYEHRDAIVAPTERRPPWPRSSDVNWPQPLL